jgi:hypothetical protein
VNTRGKKVARERGKYLGVFFLVEDSLYDEIIDEIGAILEKREVTYVEALGILECVKNNLLHNINDA